MSERSRCAGDGANDGLQDRQAGKSSRATKHKTYEHGIRGYDSTFGDKDQYKASYRQAYIQGYEKGYNGQGSDNRQIPARQGVSQPQDEPSE